MSSIDGIYIPRHYSSYIEKDIWELLFNSNYISIDFSENVNVKILAETVQ